MGKIDKYTKDLLIKLADQYETRDFIKDDPIRFPHEVANRGGSKEDIEVSAIISSWLAYGNRNQFCAVLESLHWMMNYRPYEFLDLGLWVLFKNYHANLYRFYTYHDFYLLMSRLKILYSKEAFSFTDKLSKRHPLNYLIACFHDIKGFPKDDMSACKRLNMLLRWMARKNSPVDLGLWDIDPSKLIIPVDTHVHRIALELGLTQRKQADMKTALEITDAMRVIWPNDPVKGDFALFGYGVNNK